MAVSQAYLWGAGIVFVIVPHLNLGLLSDYKICGDSECESLMSRVQAIRDHHGKDCRFLSFRRGDTIFVYHKLTGQREDLWAGSIDKQFGYFPKDAVQEEQVHATTEKVVETQKSDFFCMDEFGYPIDSSHLDSGGDDDDDDDDDDDEKIPNQESETTQTTPYTDDTNAESPSTSADVSSESPVSAQEADGTSTEEDESKSAGDAAAGTHEEAREAPAAPNEQGGSASSPWLVSSVTGWLGLAKEEEPGNVAEGEKKETQAKASFTSSVTGWLGMGGEGKPDDAEKSSEEDRETAEYFASTMTGWLGFGGEKKTDHSAEKEQDEERENDEEQEPAGIFRSRRMYLDLEDSQLHEEMGTLDWLGNSLSSTLGFGLTNQESGQETTTEREAEETIQEEEEQPASSSWLDIGIGDILGFRKDESEVDESTGSGFKETEEDETLEQPTGSENVDTSQSQPALTEEVRTETSNESKVEETPKDQNAPSEIETVPGTTEPVNADSNNNDIGASDSSKDSVLPEDAASEVDQKDISREEKSQAVGGTSSMLNSFFQTGTKEEEEDNVLDDNKEEKNILDGERSAEMEGKDHETPKSIENEGEDNNREPGEEEIKTASDSDQNFVTQSDINLGPDFSSVDLDSNSMRRSVGEVEEDKTEDVVEERAEIPNQIDNTEGSADTSVRIGASSDDHEGEGNNAETDVVHREISTTQTDDSAEQSQVSGGVEESSGKSQHFLSSGTAEERNEPISSEDSLAMIDNTETKTHQGELGQEGEGHPGEGSSQEFGSSHSTNRSTEIMSENASEEDRRTFSTSESTTQDSVSPHMRQGATRSDGDAHELKETVKETETDSENDLQPVQTETTGFEKYILNESGLKSALGSETETETETEEVEESKEEEKQEELKEVEEIKALEKQQEVAEETQDEVEELKEEEKQQEVTEIKEEGKQEEVGELKEEEEKDEMEEIKEEEKQEEVEELKEEEMQQEVKEIKEEGKQEKVEELKEEKTQEEIEELKKEEKQEVVEELKEKKKQEEVEEIKEEDNQQEVGELKEEERQGEEEELKEEEKKDEMEEIKEEKKQEEVEELKEEVKQQEVKEIKEEGKQEKVEELKEEKTQEEIEELKKEEKQEAVEELKEKKKQEEVEEIKEEDNQQEVGELKEEEKQGEELKEDTKREEVEELKEDEKWDEEKELKEEEKQHQIEELKEEKQEEVEELKEEEKREELKEVEEVKGKEKKEGKEKQVQSSHFEVETENIDRPESESNEEETQGENSLESVFSETSTQTENPQMEEENREEENKKQEEEEEVKDELKEEEAVEGERRDKEEEGSLKCSDASEDGFVRDRDGKDSANRLSSIDEETGKQNPMADRTGASQTVPFEGIERDEDRIQEEEEKEDKRNDGAKADKGKEQQNEDVNSNNANGISDLNALGVNQTGKIEYTDNDLLYPGESGQHSLSNHILLSQTAENKEGDQLYSVTELSDDNVLRQGDKTEPEDTETSSDGISTEIDTEEDTDREEREINVRHDDVRVNEDADMQMKKNAVGTEFRTEGVSVSSSEAVISEQTVPHVSQHPTSSLLTAGHNKGTAETESGGAFGLFKNAFSFFSQTPATETKESTESSPSLDSNTGETSEAQASLTPEQELDSTTDSSQVYIQDLHAGTPVTLSQQQPPSPPFIQTSSPSPTQTQSHPSSLSPNTGSPPQTRTLTKHYKNLLAYMSADEMTLLMELFGRHKLQFLDYMLSSETVTDDPDNDESILLDVERLLHYHRETLVTPSMRLADAPQEDKEKTRTLIALQKLEMLLARVREAFNTGKTDISNTNHQAEASCVGESGSTHSKDKEMATEEESSKMGDSSVGLDNKTPRDEWMGADKEKDGQLRSGGAGMERVTEDEKGGEKEKRSEDERVSPESRPHIQPGSPQPLEGVMKQILDFVHQIAEDSTTQVHAARELLIWLTVQVVSSLPDDIRPGPDLYGVPWEPVIISSLVGLMTVLLFTCRCYSSVKSRMYRSKERWMAEQVAELLDEKCKVLETLSKCQQEYDDLESSLRDSGVLAQTQKTEHLEVKARQLGHAKKELERDLEQLKDQLDQQREHRIEQERRIAVLEESMKTFEEESKDLQSQEEQAQTTLKVYNMNSDRLQKNLETAGEENTLLQESNAQLRQQVEGWAERVSELEAEMSRCEVAYSGMLQDVTNKDERIMSLTDRLLGMKAWDSDLEEEEGGEKETSNGTAGRGEENGRGDRMDTQGHLQKVQKLIYAAKLNADLKSVDEDKDRAFAKLNDEVKAKEDLQVSIKELENEKLSLQSDSEHYSDQVQRLQQKLHIMTEMYQENELKLHRLLTVEEKERMQKEEKLNKADKNIALAMEELNNYRQRAEEMEEELEKTKQSYQTQISAHEKKAHNNWLAARAADRDLADIRRENALFRQKLTDTQFKLDALDKDPYALDSLARPLPFRAERSPYGPSPLGRPASETRAFLSPPTLMDGPPARLSPRVPRGPVEPPGGQVEMERSGGPHSDSGSNSPTWERDRRGPPPGPPGPLGPPGYMFPEPGGPMYRRPPPPPGALGLLPPPGSLPPGPVHSRGLPPGPPHPADMADGTYRENSHGPGEQEHRESGPGDRRTPPEADPRMGGHPGPPMGPMGPMDGPFPRRAPYGPPPPDFYPPRGPGGPPMMPMWAPPPPGMMFPPRFPPGGPPLPLAPHPHYAPPMRPPLPDGLPPPFMGPLPPRQSLPSPPHSQSPEQHTPSPEDAI